MEKRIKVACECEGTGFIAVADNGGEDVERVECGQHHPAFKDALSVDELIDLIGNRPALPATSLSARPMREIKFRAWDKLNSKMHHVFRLEWLEVTTHRVWRNIVRSE
jgi:hypothetical protein